MKILVFTMAIVLSWAFDLMSQSSPCGDFYLACCKFDFYEKLSLHSDSTFDYKYEWKLGGESNNGKWQMHGDTLLLFDFRGSHEKADTLAGEEMQEAGKKTLSIKFVERYKNRSYPLGFSIDGRCYEYPRDTIVVLPKQSVHRIDVYKGVYTVRNPESTSIVIYMDMLHMLLKPRLVDKHLFLYRNGTLTPVACDGTLHEWQCMEQVQ